MNFLKKTGTTLGALALVVSLACLISSNIVNQVKAQYSADKDESDKSSFNNNFELNAGHLTLQFYYNQTNYQDSLTLSESYFRINILNRFALQYNQQPIPIATTEVWHSADLDECNEVDVESPLNCVILQKHLPADETKYLGSYWAKYVSKQTIKISSKYSYLNLGKGQFMLSSNVYPLRPDYIEETIDKIILKHGFENGLGFGSNRLDVGYYFEIISFDQENQFKCSGDLFLSINASRPYEGPFYNKIDLLGYLDYIFEQSNNGFLMSFDKLTCSKTLDLDDTMFISKFRMDSNFTFIKRSTFPYITCKHDMESKILLPIFAYWGSIKQQKANQSDKSYNTTISIDASSELFQDLNFKLEQLFVSDEEKLAGFEEMFFVNHFWSAIVKGDWSVNSFNKKVKFFSMHPFGLGFAHTTGSESGERKPSVEFSFENKGDDDYIRFNLKIHKKISKETDFFDLMFEGLNKKSIIELMDELRQGESGEHIHHSIPSHSDRKPEGRPISSESGLNSEL